jgi:hypothetical protein
VSVFVAAFFPQTASPPRLQGVRPVDGMVRLLHRVGTPGKEPGNSWERGWELLGKSQFVNPLKTKDNLAFSAPYIPFKYILNTQVLWIILKRGLQQGKNN